MSGLACLALRFAWRDLRGGLQGFGVFVACIALGVAAIAGVGSVAASLADGIAGAGRVILGGDLAFSLIQRPASSAEYAFLAERGAVSSVATLRAMAQPRESGPAARSAAPTLIELKAVDAAYPLFGTVVTEPAMPLPALLAGTDGVFGAAADPTLLARLNLKTGDRIAVGKAVLELRAALISEPDALAGGIGLGPRVLVSEAALQASGLIQPGSLVRWLYRLRLPAERSADGDAGAVAQQAATAFPDAGWEVRTRSKASPQLERSIERFTQFLTLVALATLMVGGVGVANAVAGHLNRKRDAIGALKALGASGAVVFAIYCTEIVLVALAAAAAGAGLGALLPFAMVHWLSAIIPLPAVPSLHPAVLVQAIGYGLLTALAFALWPLGRAHDASASMLFRDRVATERRWPRRRYLVATAATAAAFVALAIGTTSQHRIAAIFLAAAACIFLILRVAARGLMALARRLPRHRSPIVRLAIANLHRPAALTPSVMVSLGLGLVLLTTVIEIDGNLHREFESALPARAPSFFFLDIPAAAAARFDDFVRMQAPGSRLERVAMLRGRIVAANGVKADQLKPATGSAWVLRGDRGITYSDTVPPGSRVVSGDWWSADYRGEPLVSMESRTACDFGLKVGDTVTVNVLGRNVAARIANLRAVDWENLGINFVLVFSPGTFAGAPHSDIATLTFADGGTTAEETALVKALASRFPTVTAVQVKDAIGALDTIIAKLLLALRGASALTLVAAVLVLGGAIAAGQRLRIYDAVVLKTLGATRAQLLAGYGLEYLLISLATVLFAVAIGSLAASQIITRVMEFPFVWVAFQAIAAALIALLVTLAIGLAGTFAALGRKPTDVLRNL